ncbi:hypothetical protein [Pseudaminobacter sp. NGMCC 1.201702]|uniref:hypothetical protein n=1 Tax=Pseudaminobacter sp. NGMCC 1.201702 TaxID=3391825 RepID=UPI0039EE4738
MASDTDIMTSDNLNSISKASSHPRPLAEIIKRHQNAYAAFNDHCTKMAEFPRPTAAIEAENGTLDRAERDAKREFLCYRPRTLAEVKAKAAYTVLAAEAFTEADHQSVLRSFL